MSTNFESFINYLTVFLDRAGTWFLTGEALADFVCSGQIDKRDKVEIGMIDTDVNYLLERLSVFGLVPEKIGDDCYQFKRDAVTVEIQLYSKMRKNILTCRHRGIELQDNWIKCPADELDSMRQKRQGLSGNGLWRRQISDTLPQYIQLPFCYGTILDMTVPNWYLDAPRRAMPTTGDIFFNAERRVNGCKLISGLYNAAEGAGIADKLFIGFGTLLGYVMFGDFIPKDRDMDMCILSDDVTPEQSQKYGELAYNVDSIKPSRWEFSKREDTGKYCWFSVGYKNPVSENGVKSCNWFFYSWSGMWWHSKGKGWINPRKINQEKVQYLMTDQAIGLGLPVWCIQDLVEVDFNGIKVRIPNNPGSCCDTWYPGWSPNGDGASAHRNVMVVGRWDDQNTWRMV